MFVSSIGIIIGITIAIKLNIANDIHIGAAITISEIMANTKTDTAIRIGTNSSISLMLILVLY